MQIGSLEAGQQGAFASTHGPTGRSTARRIFIRLHLMMTLGLEKGKGKEGNCEPRRTWGKNPETGTTPTKKSRLPGLETSEFLEPT